MLCETNNTISALFFEIMPKIMGRSVGHFKEAVNFPNKMLSWPALNTLLSTGRLAPPRVRLVKDGANLSIDTYTRVRKERSGRSYLDLDNYRVSSQIRDGATLVIDAIDELHRPIEKLASSMERFFNEEAQVNCYVACGDKPGFPWHEDPHDAFIFQAVGCKKWQLHVPENADRLLLGTTFPGATVRDGVLEIILAPGDILYIPKGWRHAVFPVGQITVHLTVGMQFRTPVDYLAWICREAGKREGGACPLHTGDVSTVFLKEFSSVANDLGSASSVSRYLAEHSAARWHRKQFNFPWITDSSMPIAGGATVVWRLTVPLIVVFAKDLPIFAESSDPLTSPLYRLLSAAEGMGQCKFRDLTRTAGEWGMSFEACRTGLDVALMKGWLTLSDDPLLEDV